ncbi:sensor histidine kinase [Yoonia maricola]|nr:HAMP domain-containing sensor histidine kinase [Yoonia maricola]
MTVAVFGVTALFCGLTYVLVRNMLIVDFDRAVLEQFQSVANTVKVWTDGDVYVELNPTVMTGFAAGGDRAFVVRDVDVHEMIAQSISLDAAGLTIAGLAGANRDTPVFGEGTAPNGADAVIVTQVMPAQWGWDIDDTTIEVTPEAREKLVEITLAVDDTPLTARLRSLGMLTLSIAIAAALAAGAAALFTVSTVLRPLHDLAGRAAKIREPSYSRPFPADGPVELQPIAERLNDLLVRLADASLVERRFTADAAHELRTPIAELRTLTDVALRFPTAPEQLENVIRSSNDLSIRLTSLIDALLGIARKDALAAGLQMAPTNPPDMIRQIIASNAVTIAKRNLVFDVQAPQDHKITSDVTLLQSILTNLIENAVSHAPQGSTVSVIYTVTQAGLHLRVTNPAPDLDADDLDKVFEPFWRKDGQQSDRDHAGLGLALCKGFADILSLDLQARVTADQQFEMILKAT